MREISEVVTSELLDMVNLALSNGISVNKFSINMGWNNSSVKTKLKRGGYRYSANIKKYIPKEEVNSNDTKRIIKEKPINKPKSNSNEVTKNKSIGTTNNNAKSEAENIPKDMIYLENIIEKINSIDERLNRVEDLNNKETKISNRRKGKYYIENTRDTTRKGIRLYTEVKEQLDEYLLTHKDKKVIEVFSYAILDYINKYK
ncbi:MAG: hypothetical protein RSB77_05945 [Bacilli bacterium]